MTASPTTRLALSARASHHPQAMRRAFVAVCVGGLLVVSATLLPPTADRRAGPTALPEAQTPSISRYMDGAFALEENRGQAAPAVRFLAHGRGYGLFLSETGFTLTLAADERDARRPSPQSRPDPPTAQRSLASVLHF